MPKLHSIHIAVMDPEAQKRFYINVLGMHERPDGAIGYAEGEAGLVFEPAVGLYQPSSNDLYWKIAIAVPDVDLAYRQLQAQGIAIEAPRQIADVAYLTHITDTEGFEVELIDHWFQGDRPQIDVDETRLGGGPHLNLLTLRCGDASYAQTLASELGMSPLYFADLPERGFSLYFFGYTEVPPPEADPYAIENRTWTYQQPTTALEVQVRHDSAAVTDLATGAARYVGAAIEGLDRPCPENRFRLRDRSAT